MTVGYALMMLAWLAMKRLLSKHQGERYQTSEKRWHFMYAVEFLSDCVLFSEVDNGFTLDIGGLLTRWQKCTQNATCWLARIGLVNLSICSPQDSAWRRLKALDITAEYCNLFHFNTIVQFITSELKSLYFSFSFSLFWVYSIVRYQSKPKDSNVGLMVVKTKTVTLKNLSFSTIRVYRK